MLGLNGTGVLNRFGSSRIRSAKFGIGSFTWNTATNSPAAGVNPDTPNVTSVHTAMRRCLLLDNGTVNYYLDPLDSTKKADGTASTLTGADGMVMVEIPKFYTKRETAGSLVTWSISPVPASGFAVHPAFVKNGVEVNFRYYGAYDACVFDGTNYIVTNNADNQAARVNTATNKLVSVSGQFPMAGLSRAEFRSLAANRGTGWRQVDYTLVAAVQLLYLIEYQSFFSQSTIGEGNTRATTWPAGGTFATNNRACVSGLSNALGNGTGGSATGTINTSNNGDYMSYRGIENFFGNVWNWADGVIVNPDGTAGTNAGDWWFTNNSADFSDTVRTNMTQITAAAATGSGIFTTALVSADNFFVPAASSGGSSSTYITDQYFNSTSADRVVLVGGSATNGADAGVFNVVAALDASARLRIVGARVAF